MVICSGFDHRTATGCSRSGRWESNERTWSSRWELALALQRRHVVDERFSVAARINRKVEAVRQLEKERSAWQGATSDIGASELFVGALRAQKGPKHGSQKLVSGTNGVTKREQRDP